MKRILLTLLLAVSLLMVLGGCHFNHGVRGSGVRKTEKREVASFKAIDTSGAYEVEVTCQQPVALQIEADDNVLPLIQTDVRDGVLYVRNEKSYDSNQAVKLKISTPNLERLKSTGAGKFRVADVKNDKFSIESTGASAVSANGQTQSLEVHSTGAGQIDVGQL